MSIVKRKRYIDENQYIKLPNGKISWKDMIGKEIEFFIDDEKYVYKIIEMTSTNNYKIIINNEFVIDNIKQNMMKDLYFGKQYQFKPRFLYNVGDVLEGKLGKYEIIEKIVSEKADDKGNPYQWKLYKCKCLIDGYEWVMPETDIKQKRGCPACGHKLCPGYNDVATTRPDLVKYFKNPDDAKNVMAGAGKVIDFKCPDCGYEKSQRIAEVSSEGFSCPMCSDGISFPNKFARNLFLQLSDQYDYYEYEWSPEWAGKMLYDNYIELKDGRKIIVEMDGGFHYKTGVFDRSENDEIKNKLAEEYGITIIRVECDYRKSSERYEYVKGKLCKAIEDIFDLSNIDWNVIQEQSLKSRMIEVIEEYNKDTSITFKELSSAYHQAQPGIILKRAQNLGCVII